MFFNPPDPGLDSVTGRRREKEGWERAAAPVK
jgi:hypothetical protein